jgi:hypothetical protein
MGVSRSGFYGYLRAQQRTPDPENEEKLGWVKVLDEGSSHAYGSRRMAKGLRALGYPVGRHQEKSDARGGVCALSAPLLGDHGQQPSATGVSEPT